MKTQKMPRASSYPGPWAVATHIVILCTSVQGTYMATLEMSIATTGEGGVMSGGGEELEFVGPITQ